MEISANQFHEISHIVENLIVIQDLFRKISRKLEHSKSIQDYENLKKTIDILSFTCNSISGKQKKLRNNFTKYQLRFTKLSQRNCSMVLFQRRLNGTQRKYQETPSSRNSNLELKQFPEPSQGRFHEMKLNNFPKYC